MTKKLLFACFAMVAACGAPTKEPADDDFSALAGFDEKSDKFTGSMTVVGSIAYGETKGPFQHKAGKWSAVKFLATAGDKIVVDVKSTNGDTVAWLVDKSSEILAYNDDVKWPNTNSHFEYTFKTGANTTFYIVTRDYSRKAMKFTVSLKGEKGVDFTGPCTKDADCTVVMAGCCGAVFTGVRADQAEAYTDSLACMVRCASYFPVDHAAQCQENKCVAVEAKDIACGGHTINPHICPDRYVCEGKQMAYDAPGSCTKRCGGIAGLQCDGTDICVEDPNDDCDPSTGGADCMGVCRDAICSGQTAKCTATTHWDQFECTCVPNPVVEEDCRTLGCGDGQWCSFCWTSFQCIPNGALC